MMDGSDTPSMDWIPKLGNLVGRGGPDGVLLSQDVYDKHVWSLISLIGKANVGILEVLRPLGGYLTTEDDVPRCRAISFLASLVSQSPELLRTEGDVHHLLEFFTARLGDWPALHGALMGAHALLQHHKDKAETQGIVDLVQALNDGVYIRSLGVNDRSRAFNVIACAVDSCGQEILDADVDLAEMIIVSIDGEKDPRCLLDGFTAARKVLNLYEKQDDDSIHRTTMDNASEEMFDVLSCYFPISFTPPPEDVNRITREDLSMQLNLTLVSWSGFGPMLLDLVEEKMSSIVKQAKADALSLLTRMTESSTCDNVLLTESRRIWSILRHEIFSFSIESQEQPGSSVLHKTGQSKDEALWCLAQCLKVCSVH